MPDNCLSGAASVRGLSSQAAPALLLPSHAILKGASTIGTNLRVGCSLFAATLLGLSGIFVHAPWSAYDDRSLSQDTLAKAACQ